jgi:hypothetical protein
MPYTDVEIDPVTKRPLQAAAPQQRPQTQPAPQQQVFDVEKFAADSATRQLQYDMQRWPGYHPDTASYEEARKQAYTEGMETARQIQLDQMRRQGELQKSETLQQFERYAPRPMSEAESKDATPLLNVHNQLMMLYHQNQDIPADHAYRNVVTGGAGAAIGGATDARVRLYESTRDGLITTIARGLGMDTGSAAGKEQAQALFSRLMPGPGDDVQMSARKTADMNQMELNQLKAQIESLPQNVDSTPLKQAYARSYNDYAGLVNQYGSDAQKNFPAPSPQQLWGQNAPGNQSAIVQPAVKAGVSAPSNAVITNLNAQVTGGTSQAQSGAALPAPNQSGSTLASSSQPAPTAFGAAVQQAGQYAGGSTVMTPQNMPPVQGSLGQVPTAAALSNIGGAVQGGVQATGQAAQAGLGWLQSLLPENWANQTGGQFNR